jgi:hypothetical protein
MKGDTIEWINTDTKPHILVIHPTEQRIGPIHPNQVAYLKFDYQVERIDYECAEHSEEQGTIVMYPKREDEMTNTERIRFLSRVFDITPPSFLSHLGSQQDE